MKRKTEKRSTKEKSVDNLNTTVNDFEDDDFVFRFPQKSQITSNDSKPLQRGGRPRKATILQRHNSKLSRSNHSSQSHTTDDVKLADAGKRQSPSLSSCINLASTSNSLHTTTESPLNGCSVTSSSRNDDDEEDINDLEELEKSVCSSTEKLCPSCKSIVTLTEYSDHFSKCLRRFSFIRHSEKQKETVETSSSLPCPICLKLLTVGTDRSSHIKSCGSTHGLSTEKTILATRLQEKQAEERIALGLPSPIQLKENVVTRKKGSGSRTKSTKDPDLLLAFALSRSLAEEEKERRAREEDRLLTLGLEDVIQEGRRSLVLPQPPPLTSNGSKARGCRGKKKAVAETTLMKRTAEDRERILTEKVAALLVDEIKSSHSRDPTRSRRASRTHRSPLDTILDQKASLWHLGSSPLEAPFEDHFVDQLKDFIQPQLLPVGELLRNLSQIPGRLNHTALIEDADKDTDEEGETTLEATIIDHYCTQLALAEMLDTQELTQLNIDLEDVEVEVEDKKKEGMEEGEVEIVGMDREPEVMGEECNNLEVRKDKCSSGSVMEGKYTMIQETEKKSSEVELAKRNETFNEGEVVERKIKYSESEVVEREEEKGSEGEVRQDIEREVEVVTGNEVNDSLHENEHLILKDHEVSDSQLSKTLSMSTPDNLPKMVLPSFVSPSDTSKSTTETSWVSFGVSDRFRSPPSSVLTLPSVSLTPSSPRPPVPYTSNLEASSSRFYLCDDSSSVSYNDETSVDTSNHETSAKSPYTHKASTVNFFKTPLNGSYLHKASSVIHPQKVSSSITSPDKLSSCPHDVSENSPSLQSKLIYDWSRFLASGDQSDLNIVTEDGVISVHSLVLAVRCPSLLTEALPSSHSTQGDLQERRDTPHSNALKWIDWNTVPYETAYSFMVYLYSGVCTVKSKNEGPWMNLFELSLKYQCHELVAHLEEIYKSGKSGDDDQSEGCASERVEHATNCMSADLQIDLKSPPGDRKELKETDASCMNSKLSLSLPVDVETHKNRTQLNVLANTIHTPAGDKAPSGNLNFEESPDLFGDWYNNDTPHIPIPKSQKSNSVPEGNIPFPDLEDVSEHKKSPEEVNTTLDKNDSVVVLSDCEESEIKQNVDATSHKNLDIGMGESCNVVSDKENEGTLLSGAETSSELGETAKTATITSDLPNEEDTIDCKKQTPPNSPLSDFSYPSGNEVVDLTLSSEESSEFSAQNDNHLSPEKKEHYKGDNLSPFENASLQFSPGNTSKLSSKEYVGLSPIKVFKNVSPIQKRTDWKRRRNLSGDLKSASSAIDVEYINQTLENESNELKDAKKYPFKSPCKEPKKLSEHWIPSPTKVYSKENWVISPMKTRSKEKRISPSKNLYPQLCISSPKMLHSKENCISSPKSLNLKEISISSPKMFHCTENLLKNYQKELHSKEEFWINAPEKPSAKKMCPGLNLDSHQTSSGYEEISDDSLLCAVLEVEQNLTSGKANKETFGKGQQPAESSECWTKDSSPAKSFLTPVRGGTKGGESPLSGQRSLEITPLPDYKAMLTPQLQKELDKFGIRKMSRKKAVKLLLHIYDQMHPLVTDNEAEGSSIKESRREPMSKRKGTNGEPPRKDVAEASRETKEVLNSSHSSVTSLDSEFDCLEETVMPAPDDNQHLFTSSQQTTLDTRLKEFIKSDRELHAKILTYEPIWVNELQETLKANGIKCSIPKLIDFLDEQCITFRFPAKERRRKKRKHFASPSKSPRKKVPRR